MSREFPVPCAPHAPKPSSTPIDSMHRLLFLGALALASLVLALSRVTTVEATTVLELGLDGLVERADVVLEARVLGAEAGIDERGRIVTRYTLAVGRTFRGTHRAHFTMNVPGGVLPDGRGLVVPGMPRLVVGEEAVLFLSSENVAGVRVPVGLGQGRYRVVRAAGGTKRLVREHGDVEFVDATGRLKPAPAGVETLDYAATIATIEAACAARAARERGGARR